VHPENTWAICVDRECIVSVWDFSRKERMMCRSMHDLIKLAEHGGKYSTVKSNTQRGPLFLSSRLESVRSIEAIPNDFLSKEETGPSGTSASKAKEYGDVKKVSFIDSASLRWSCSMHTSNSSHSFHTHTRIMIVCETVILFCEFATKVSHVLTAAELTKAPCTAEFISPDLCAVACVDGQIR